MSPPPDTPALRSRLAWFIVLWCAGVAAVAVAGLLIRLVLQP